MMESIQHLRKQHVKRLGWLDGLIALTPHLPRQTTTRSGIASLDRRLILVWQPPGFDT